jgi:hypothetical protein
MTNTDSLSVATFNRIYREGANAARVMKPMSSCKYTDGLYRNAWFKGYKSVPVSKMGKKD